MSGKRLHTLLIAGCLTLEAAGCRSCLVEPWGALRERTPRAQRQTCEVLPPGAPQVSSDQHRSIAPSTSPSPESPDSPAQYADDASPDSPATAAEPREAAQDQQVLSVEALRKLGARVSRDADDNVTAVDLAQTPVTDGDLQLLAPCTGLTELNLRGALITDTGLQAISSCTRLEFLGLTGTMVTDAGMVHLQQLSNLRFLTLGHTAVTDAGLEALAACARLEGLNLKATAVTAAGLVQFQARLPNCRIVSDVTATTSIDSQDLPLPMDDQSATSTDVTGSAAPQSDEPIGLPESLADPFAPLQQAQPETTPETVPESPDEIPAPPSAERAPERLRPSGAHHGPARRLERVLSDSLGDPSVLRAIGQSYAARGEWDAAAAVLRAAVERTPDDQQLQFELGVAEARSGDYVAALMHLQQCGDLAVAHYNLGVLLHDAGLKDASILAFRSALRYNPALSPARQWLTELAPGQAAAAAAAAGQRPAMIGARGITPVEGRSTDDAKTTDAATSGIEIRPTGARRTVARPQRTMSGG